MSAILWLIIVAAAGYGGYIFGKLVGKQEAKADREIAADTYRLSSALNRLTHDTINEAKKSLPTRPTEPTPMTPFIPKTRKEQMQDYDTAMKNFRLQYELWKANGEKGPPPPRPIRPHTVGRRF